MATNLRMIVIGSIVGVAGGFAVLAAPNVIGAVNEVPVEAVTNSITDLFPAETVDPDIFRKFDIKLGPEISTAGYRTRIVKKLGYGYSTTVTIVTTPSGTYSTDGLLSPHVLYPGIEVTPKAVEGEGEGRWTALEHGSFIFYMFTGEPAART